MDTNQFIALTEEHKIVPVFYHENSDVVIKTIQASYDGGIRIFEFVNRGANGLEIFKIIINHFSMQTDLIIGVGTIYDSSTAKEFVELGAQFIVSPGLVTELGQYCIDNRVAYIPGVATITEVITAKQLGCDMIKIFPANVIGSAFAKAVKSVMPSIAIMPTGGIEPTESSLSEWLNAGVNCVGMGSQLFDKKKIAKSDFSGLREDISKAITIINSLK
jgi:2-dehydro-3-deoxyphosphogluconate aldolase/(4S)-4-hydroxy-2-oxoglutarate aldolase